MRIAITFYTTEKTMNLTLNMQTEENFTKARNKALFGEIQHFLSPEESKLLSFTDIKEWLKPQNEIYMGMQVVPVNLIVGSEGRYQDFDNHFFPKNIHLKSRWKRIDEARLTDIILPPIQLYEISGLYFVRDGNHRVSVARTQGIENIDAEVTSLQSEIKISPNMTRQQILKKVLDYEKRIFYAITAFGDITDCWTIDFSTPGQYDVIYNHIQVHQYYLNENNDNSVNMTQAIISWYQTVYLPVLNSIKKHHILKKFKKRTPADMYVWLIKYWDELKHKFDDTISIDRATVDFKNKFSKNIFHKILKRFQIKS